MGKPTEYVYDRIVSHRDDPNNPGKRLYCIRWHGYNSSDDTEEPAENIPYNTILRYCRRHKLEVTFDSNQDDKGVQLATSFPEQRLHADVLILKKGVQE